MEQINTVVKVEGGGLIGQAEAIKLGVARAIAQMSENQNSEIRKGLKDKGFLTQDSRIKERRKYGLKKARKASQYHKR
jgi:small subunit ribosomal protein S9